MANTSVATLTECDGPNAGRRHALGLGRAVLGRASEAAVRLDGGEVSRRHAELEVEARGLWLRDLGAKNGVRVDGRQVDRGAKIPLGDGARIELGGITLEVAHPGARVHGLLEREGELTTSGGPDRARPRVGEGSGAFRDPRPPLLFAFCFGVAALAVWWASP